MTRGSGQNALVTGIVRRGGACRLVSMAKFHNVAKVVDKLRKMMVEFFINRLCRPLSFSRRECVATTCQRFPKHRT